MKKLVLATVVAAISVAPAYLTPAQAWDSCDGGGGGGTKQHADNGWGNGPDSTNNGSFSGATAASKSTNGYGSGPGPSNFSTR